MYHVTTSSPHSLAGAPLFAGLDNDDIRALDRRCLWRRVEAGGWVIDRSASGNEVYFILSGHAHVVIASPAREVILGDVRDGDFVGELSAIDNKPRSGGIRAVTDVVAAVMPAATFREAIRRHPIVGERVLQRIVLMARGLISRAEEQSNFDVRARLCAELLRLARVGVANRLVVSPPPTHVELAARVGSRREVVTKLLSAMRSEGILQRSRGALTLVKPDRLREIVAEAEQGRRHL